MSLLHLLSFIALARLGRTRIELSAGARLVILAYSDAPRTVVVSAARAGRDIVVIKTSYAAPCKESGMLPLRRSKKEAKRRITRRSPSPCATTEKPPSSQLVEGKRRPDETRRLKERTTRGRTRSPAQASTDLSRRKDECHHDASGRKDALVVEQGLEEPRYL